MGLAMYMGLALVAFLIDCYTTMMWHYKPAIPISKLVAEACTPQLFSVLLCFNKHFTMFVSLQQYICDTNYYLAVGQDFGSILWHPTALQKEHKTTQISIFLVLSSKNCLG